MTFYFFLDYADSMPDSKQNFAYDIFVFMPLSLSLSAPKVSLLMQ